VTRDERGHDSGSNDSVNVATSRSTAGISLTIYLEMPSNTSYNARVAKQKDHFNQINSQHRTG
ncbi:hypothetical protein, partial [Microcoleus sp. FACHB-68]|uniref:hypothetical protein n=1 Tax=Microcoleus sp. FACHB-68 TaxID=2692826 RepID=UPI001A7E3B2E